MIEHGVKAPEFGDAMGAFVGVLDRMQADLSDRTWLAGDAFSLADAATLPYVMRLDHLAMTPLLDARPRVAEWYAAVQARPSFEVAISKLLPQFIVDMFRKSGEEVWSEVRAIVG